MTHPDFHTEAFRVAVIAPAEVLPYWERSAEWAKEIQHRAQTGMERRIRVEFEYHDENDADIDRYIQKVAEDERYAAIVGPVSPEKATIAARACRTLKKTLILPMTTNAEFQRIFSTLDHVFNLTQSDIIQMEAMLATMDETVIKDFNNFVGLIASDDQYGETFYDWVGFLAAERGFETPINMILTDSASLSETVRRQYELMKEGTYIFNFFVGSSNAHDLIRINEEFDKMAEYHNTSNDKWLYAPPKLLCSDACVNDEIAAILKNGIEGVEPTADPASGFIVAYDARFGEHPRRGEAQFFDAVYLLYYSLRAMLADGRQLVENSTDKLGYPCRHSPLWQYFIKVVDGDPYNAYAYNWLDYDVQHVLESLDNNNPITIRGVSSKLDFDVKYHCSVMSTTYRHWKLHDGKYVTLQYFSADGSDRSLSTITDWSFKVQMAPEVDPYITNIAYPEHKNNYAVIVAASKGWSNYRHQADALAMYHALKSQGFNDDNILLIMEDDIAYHDRNLYPGRVSVTKNGVNLYEGVKADYQMSRLYPADIHNILTGVRTVRTPVVLDATEHDNVFLFWSGHGNSNSLLYNDNDFTSLEVRRMLETMKERKKFRKLFFVMETCFSGSVANACEGIEGVLMLTAANEGETSKADMYDDELGVYLSNGFTRAFQTKIHDDPYVTLRDLYFYVVRQTVGSHASLYNYKNYGNIYTERLNELLFNKESKVP